MLVHLHKGQPFAQVAAGFRVGIATAWRYVRETTRLLLAALAPTLEQGLRNLWSGASPRCGRGEVPGGGVRPSSTETRPTTPKNSAAGCASARSGCVWPVPASSPHNGWEAPVQGRALDRLAGLLPQVERALGAQGLHLPGHARHRLHPHLLQASGQAC